MRSHGQPRNPPCHGREANGCSSPGRRSSNCSIAHLRARVIRRVVSRHRVDDRQGRSTGQSKPTPRALPPYLHRELLVDLWRQALLRAECRPEACLRPVLDIRAMRDAQSGARELIKDLTKDITAGGDKLPPELYAQWVKPTRLPGIWRMQEGGHCTSPRHRPDHAKDARAERRLLPAGSAEKPSLGWRVSVSGPRTSSPRSEGETDCARARRGPCPARTLASPLVDLRGRTAYKDRSGGPLGGPSGRDANERNAAGGPTHAHASNVLAG